MGYRPKHEPFKLDFTGSEYDGLEITARPLPASVMIDMVTAAKASDVAGYRQIAATFAYALESWNVEDDDGQPVPLDVDGLMSQDWPFLNAVITAWVTAMAGGSA